MMTKALILYTDGSARPNPGWAGWGLHGYYCNVEPPKSGAGHKTHILTDLGYRAKLDAGAKKHEVTPVEYIDFSGSLPNPNTNNAAELKALTEALKLALRYDVQKLLVHTDSKMVVDGTNEWIDKWKKNGWVKRDGGQISSVQLWKEIDDLKRAVIDKGIVFNIQWIKAHSDDPGNTQADKLSVIGTVRSQRNETKKQEDITAPAGYWKYEVNRNPLLDFSGLFFNTLEGYNESGLYYLCNKYKEDEVIMEVLPDKAYGVVKLKTPDDSIEFIRNYQSKITGNGKRDLLVMLRLDQLFKPDVNNDITTYGETLLTTVGKYSDIYRMRLNENVTEEPITRVLMPPKLASEAIESLSHLSCKLEEYLANDPKNTLTDITDAFYEKEVITKKKEETVKTKLKDKFIVGFSKLEVDVNYKLTDIINQTKLILSFGVDIIGRNALKRIENQEPKITVLTWMESDLMFRFAIVVETSDDISIWSADNSNLKLLKK